MKQLVFIIILIFLYNPLNSQEKFDFKGLSIGDDYAKWSNVLVFDKKDETTQESIYILNHPNFTKVFNYDIKYVEVKFKYNKLTSIFITLEPFEEKGWRSEEFESIRDNFDQLFGKNKGFEKIGENTGNLFYIWENSKVSLLMFYIFNGSQSGSTIKIIMTDINIKKQNITNGF